VNACQRAMLEAYLTTPMPQHAPPTIIYQPVYQPQPIQRPDAALECVCEARRHRRPRAARRAAVLPGQAERERPRVVAATAIGKPEGEPFGRARAEIDGDDVDVVWSEDGVGADDETRDRDVGLALRLD
jgi:hypothetical protein